MRPSLAEYGVVHVLEFVQGGGRFCREEWNPTDDLREGLQAKVKPSQKPQGQASGSRSSGE